MGGGTKGTSWKPSNVRHVATWATKAEQAFAGQREYEMATGGEGKLPPGQYKQYKAIRNENKVKCKGLSEHYDLPWKYELKYKNTNLRIITERKLGSDG